MGIMNSGFGIVVTCVMQKRGMTLIRDTHAMLSICIMF